MNYRPTPPASRHGRSHIEPSKSRAQAFRTSGTLLKAMKTDVVISGSHNDLPHLKAYSDSSRHEASIKRFKLAFGSEEDGVSGDVGILIVNNMLLTGFDAPVEQVMYLDKAVVAHNLVRRDCCSAILRTAWASWRTCSTPKIEHIRGSSHSVQVIKRAAFPVIALASFHCVNACTAHYPAGPAILRA